MSRFLPGKRKQTDVSPEKTKTARRLSSALAESSSSGSLQLPDGSNGPPNAALAGAPLSPQRSNLLKKLPSVGDLRNTANGNRRSSVVFDPSAQVVHSRSGNFSIDEQTALSRQSTRDSTSNRRSTYSTHSNNGVIDSQGRATDGSSGLTASESAPSQGGASLQFMSNPALALDTKVNSFSAAELDTPRPRYETLDGPSSNVRLFVTDSGANKENEEPHHGEGASQYPPVFDASDIGTSSSSSSNSPALGTSDSATSTGYFTRPKIQVRHSTSSGNVKSARNAPTTTATLAPASAETNRPRSASASSVISDGSLKESTSPGIRLRNPSNNKKGRSNSSLVAALAASGISMPSPAGAVSQPMKPVAQRSADSYTSNGAQSSGSKSASNSRPGPLLSRSSEEGPSGYDSPTPLSNYTPNDSPKYEDDAYQAMVTMDAIRDFDDVMSQLGAGYALASSKRNADFHGVFKTVPEEDYLIEDYGCALQREILIQGRLYISEHHLSFHANIFGWITNVVLAFNEIVAIEKRNTALVIPNAIHIATIHSRHTFASFISRDTTYELITSLWRNHHPVFPPSAALPEAALTDDEDDLAAGTQDDGECGSQKRKKKKMKDRFKKNKGSGNNALLEARDIEDNTVNGQAQTANGDTTVLHSLNGRPSLGAGQLNKKSPVHPPSTCTCGPSAGIGPHLVTEIMDTTFPGSPEKIYNLIFTSGFMVDFLTTDMKLTELQMGDWAPQKTGSHLLTRSYNYIKPLNAPVGPKSAKCILVDENLHVDFDDFVVTVTTTRTPEVPSGGSFSVKTKTCIMWAKNNTTRVLVTSAMEWTGRSFIRGIIDKSSMDGQRALYVALEKAMRAYISQHKSEFYQGGEESSIDNGDHEYDHTDAAPGAADKSPSTGKIERPQGTIVEGQKTRSLPVLDAISGAVPLLKPLTDFLATLYDTILDFTGQMSLTALVCSAVIFVLVVSNLFTLSSLREKSSRYVPTRRPPPDYSNSKLPGALAVQTEGEQYEVAQAVRGVLQEYFDSQKRSASFGQAGLANKQDGSLTPKEELADITAMLDSIEERVRTLRATLAELD